MGKSREVNQPGTEPEFVIRYEPATEPGGKPNIIINDVCKIEWDDYAATVMPGANPVQLAACKIPFLCGMFSMFVLLNRAGDEVVQQQIPDPIVQIAYYGIQRQIEEALGRAKSEAAAQFIDAVNATRKKPN